MTPTSTPDRWPWPYLTAAEATEYLRFPNIKALMQAVYDGHIPVCHRGRRVLFDRRELDAKVRGMYGLDLTRQLRRVK